MDTYFKFSFLFRVFWILESRSGLNECLLSFLDPSLLQQLDSSCYGRPSIVVFPEPCARHHNSARSLAPIKCVARGGSAATQSPGSRRRAYGTTKQA